MQDKNVTLLINLTDKIIAFNRVYAQIGGNANTGLLLSQLLYWARTKNWGEFYKSNEELQFECFLTRREFEGSRQKIIDKKIISITRRGNPGRIFYQINLEILVELITNLGIKDTPDSVNVQNVHVQNVQGKCTKRTSVNVQNVHSIYTENTTENTSEINTPLPPLSPKEQIGEKKEFRYFEKNLPINESPDFLPFSDEQQIHRDEEMTRASMQLFSDTIIRLGLQSKFTKAELLAIGDYARAQPKLIYKPHLVEAMLKMVLNWAQDGLDISPAIRCSAGWTAPNIKQPIRRVELDDKGNQIFCIEKLQDIRWRILEKQIAERNADQKLLE
jgi:hypothetical protein